MVLFRNIQKIQDTPYKKLRSKWSKRHTNLKEQLLTKHKDSLDWLVKNMPVKKQIAAGSLSGLLLLAPPALYSLPTHTSSQSVKEKPLILSKRTVLLTELGSLIPDQVRPLTPDEESKITDLLSKHMNLSIRAELQGIRLNTSYGYIGAEQHLMRYPGDTIWTHFATPSEASMYADSGMAPGRGAWGYFSYSKVEMTKLDLEREKYYIAVQTFLAPGFTGNVRKYSEFFKYRKMLIINPQNGKAMTVVIADAGPAEWTGKQLGGSPEVMDYLERVDGRQKGPVLYFFIDDPSDTVPLGPIDL